jgi:hypothetical protein
MTVHSNQYGSAARTTRCLPSRKHPEHYFLTVPSMSQLCSNFRCATPKNYFVSGDWGSTPISGLPQGTGHLRFWEGSIPSLDSVGSNVPERDSGEVPRGDKMLYSGADPESDITEYDSVYEDSLEIGVVACSWEGRE